MSVAVDGGAHVGGWTAALADLFQFVHAFEPAPDTFQRLQANVADRPNVQLYQMALMQQRQTVAIARGWSSPARQVVPAQCGDILAGTIDELNLPTCGFIKLDLEGCEPFALAGAGQTITRCRPFVLVEEAGLSARFGFADDTVPDLMAGLGYRETVRRGVNVGYLPE